MLPCIILGLDNSTKCTGWSIIKHDIQYNILLDYGTIDRNNKDLLSALVKFESTLIEIINTYSPNFIAAEQMFIGTNRITGMHLAYIHGIMLLVAKKHNIPVTYYSPMTLKSQILNGISVKKTTGERKTGDEMKQEVQNAVINILGKEQFTKEYNNDITDSISAALVFIKNEGKEIPTKKNLKKSTKKAFKETSKKDALKKDPKTAKKTTKKGLKEDKSKTSSTKVSKIKTSTKKSKKK